MSNNFGIPYLGSKNKIADWVIDQLPSATHFYDLFCGGCAVTHCALLHRKYHEYFINDIIPVMPKLFIDAVTGRFRHENRWISREDFFRLKDKDGYARVCFSFGSDGRGYAYARELEPFKKAFHSALFFNDYSDFARLGVKITPPPPRIEWLPC